MSFLITNTSNSINDTVVFGDVRKRFSTGLQSRFSIYPIVNYFIRSVTSNESTWADSFYDSVFGITTAEFNDSFWEDGRDFKELWVLMTHRTQNVISVGPYPALGVRFSYTVNRTITAYNHRVSACM